MLVGLDSADDAAVWKLDSQRALVLTTDFFTPVVDDPYDYGAIAAANSLSDIYAMGGQPFMALNIAALPPNLPAELLAEILRGGAEKALEAGVVVAGGHTVQDKEPKFGLVVVGFVHPDHILTKDSLRVGDRLVLTKPLGTGVTTTALKREKAQPEDVAEAVAWMKRLNRGGAQLAVEFELRAATDITGFSLLGHSWEMAQSSGVGLRFDYARLPFLAGAAVCRRLELPRRRFRQRLVLPGARAISIPIWTKLPGCCSSTRRPAGGCCWRCRLSSCPISWRARLKLPSLPGKSARLSPAAVSLSFDALR